MMALAATYPQISTQLHYTQVPAVEMHTPEAAALPQALGGHPVPSVPSSFAVPHGPPPGSASPAQLDPLPPGDAAGLHWTVLPALPAPNLGEMRSQAAGGCVTVLGIIAACVGGTHGSVAAGMDGVLAMVFLVAIWVEAAVAL